MALIHVYGSVDSQHETFRAEGKLRDILKERGFENVICIKAGERLPEDYEVLPEDVIFVRTVPGSSLVIATLVITAAVVVAGVGIGVAVAQNMKRQAQEEAEKAQRNAKNLAQKIEQWPFVKGAKNKNAIGNSVQYLMGEMYNVPYLLTDGYYTLSGEKGKDLYWNGILCCGYKDQLIESLSIGNTKVKQFNNLMPQSGVYSFDSTSAYYDSENIIEIAQGAEFTNPAFTRKVKCRQVGKEIKHDYGLDAEPVIEQIEPNTKTLEVCVQFNGLRRYNSDAENWETRSVTIVPSWSNDGGTTWNTFAFDGGNTFTANSKTTIRFKATKTFTPEEALGKDILVKLERTNPKLENNSNEDAYLLYMQSFCYDAEKADETALPDCAPLEPSLTQNTTRIGIRIKSTENTNDVLDEINIISCGVAKLWNGRAWTEDKRPTRNPASWIYEILTSEAHVHSQLQEAELDTASFGELYEYCEANGFYVDGILTQGVKKRDLISQILSTCDATLYRDGHDGLLHIAIDRPEESPVALLNEQCIKSIKVAKSLVRKPDGIKLTFLDREAWQQSTRYAMLDGGEKEADDAVTETALSYTTDAEHVYKVGQRTLRRQVLQPREITVDVGNEGDYYPLYSTVLLQVPRFKHGLCSTVVTDFVVQGGKLKALSFGDEITFETGVSYGAIIQAQSNSGRDLLSLKISGTGKAHSATVVGDVPENAYLRAGNIASIGVLENNDFTRITETMKIMGMEPCENGWTLKLADYNPQVYEYGEIPEYKSNLTLPVAQTGTIKEKYVTNDDLLDSFSGITSGSSSFVGTPMTVTGVNATAHKDGIAVSWNALDDAGRNGLHNMVQYYTVHLYKPDAEEESGYSVSLYTTNSSSFEYVFDRNTDGYPEHEELEDWYVTVTATNAFGRTSQESNRVYINTRFYGTYILAAPVITKRESNRTVTLYFSQPQRADGRECYGNVRHRVQIKRITPPADESYFKPAQSANPYESEDNYKDGEGFVVTSDNYSQTLPLMGQDLDEPIPCDTSYAFKVVAYNEASESPASEINTVAHATSIRDIVENAIGNAQIKNDAVTADKIFVEMLSAIQSNLGYITSGSFEGTENNRWTLSTVVLEDGSTRYEGAMRVGGDDEYFEVEPYNIVGGVPQNYHVKFKAGNFEIAATASSINGILYIQKDDRALDRTMITPNGTYYQHRETVNSEWKTIASSNVNGVMAKQVFSEDTLFITNQDMAERRKQGYDIGNTYLSSASKVYHFDTDIFDQNGVNDLVIEDAIDGGSHNLVGADTESDDIDFTPAILAIAPYATLGKSLYGRYGITAAYGSCNVFTVDFWLQYIYAENQVIFDIGNAGDKIKLIIASGECYFEKGTEDESGIPFNAEIAQSRLYNILPLADVLFNKASAGEIAFNEAGAGECPFESIAVKEFNANYVYYEKTIAHGVETWSVAEVTAANYYTMLKAGLYEKTLPFNVPDAAHSYLQHDGQTQSEQRELSDIGVSFTPNDWLHIGIIASPTKITVAINDRSVEFTRYETAAAALSVVLNGGKNSFMLDELLVDITAEETVQTFYEHTINRIPWAKLTKSNDYFILTVKDLENFKTNIFDTQIFKDKVLEVIHDYINSNS